MKAIYSFKKLVKGHKPLDETFFKVAASSVNSVSKFYDTVLYTDKYGSEIFKSKNIHFDKIIIDDDIEKYDGELECMPRILTMVKQNEPYIHMDFTVLIFEKIWSPHTLTYSYWDLNLSNNSKTDQLESMLYHYYNPYITTLKDVFENELEPKWNQVPNQAFFMVKNTKVVKQIYEIILEKLPTKKVNNPIYVNLIEQFLFFQYVKKYRVDFGFVNEYGTDSITNKIEGSYKLYNIPYWWLEDKKSEVNKILDDLLKRFNIENNFKKTLV